ncbi:Vps55 protein [Pichia kluyveri]|uniref:Vps55 protein n=1 Tax=Pichia kluyveri TaxID=36015 RepID=A0AAV5R525_PICKL|nr:Vps55 protein [Pichia kluyveri]
MALRFSPLTRIIALSGLLALGFLLVALATALYSSWLPIFDALIFAVAHIPVLLTQSYDSSSLDLDSFDGTFNDSPASDLGKWISSFLLTAAVVWPITLSRNAILSSTASTITIVGGILIHTTIVLFTTFFSTLTDNDDPFSM